MRDRLTLGSLRRYIGGKSARTPGTSVRIVAGQDAVRSGEGAGASGERSSSSNPAIRTLTTVLTLLLEDEKNRQALGYLERIRRSVPSSGPASYAGPVIEGWYGTGNSISAYLNTPVTVRGARIPRRELLTAVLYGDSTRTKGQQ